MARRAEAPSVWDIAITPCVVSPNARQSPKRWTARRLGSRASCSSPAKRASARAGSSGRSPPSAPPRLRAHGSGHHRGRHRRSRGRADARERTVRSDPDDPLWLVAAVVTVAFAAGVLASELTARVVVRVRALWSSADLLLFGAGVAAAFVATVVVAITTFRRANAGRLAIGGLVATVAPLAAMMTFDLLRDAWRGLVVASLTRFAVIPII